MSELSLFRVERDRALKYAMNALAMGDTLSRAISEHLNEFTDYFTLADPGASDASLSEGGRKPSSRVLFTSDSRMEQVETDDERLAALLSICSTSVPSAAIFENFLRSRGDAVLRRYKCQVRYRENEVLHVVTGPGRLEPDELMQCMRESRCLPRSLGALLAASPTLLERLHQQEDISASELGDLVNGLRVLFVSAFDGESYLVGLTPETKRDLDRDVTGRGRVVIF